MWIIVDVSRSPAHLICGPQSSHLGPTTPHHSLFIVGQIFLLLHNLLVSLHCRQLGYATF